MKARKIENVELARTLEVFRVLGIKLKLLDEPSFSRILAASIEAFMLSKRDDGSDEWFDVSFELPGGEKRHDTFSTLLGFENIDPHNDPKRVRLIWECDRSTCAIVECNRFAPGDNTGTITFCLNEMLCPYCHYGVPTTPLFEDEKFLEFLRLVYSFGKTPSTSLLRSFDDIWSHPSKGCKDFDRDEMLRYFRIVKVLHILKEQWLGSTVVNLRMSTEDLEKNFGVKIQD